MFPLRQAHPRPGGQGQPDSKVRKLQGRAAEFVRDLPGNNSISGLVIILFPVTFQLVFNLKFSSSDSFVPVGDLLAISLASLQPVREEL